METGVDGSSLPPWLLYAAAALLATLAILRATTLPRRRSPPGPRPWPIIGNLPSIGPLPHRSLHELSLKHGPLLQIFLGSRRVLVASSVPMAKEILKTNDLVFASRPRTAAGKYTAYNYQDITWAPYGPYWRQARRICATELFSAKRLHSSAHIRTEEMQSMLARLAAAVARGAPVRLKDALSSLGLSVISRMVLGRDYTAEDGGEAAAASPEEFRTMLDELFFLNGVLNIGDMIPWLDFLDLQGHVARMKAVGEKFDAFFDRVLEEHEGRRRRAGGEFVPADMVDVLLQLAGDPSLEVKLTRDGVKGFAQDMIAGGTESSAVTVEWAMAELLRRPEAMDRARREMESVVGRERWVEEKDLARLPFVNAVMKETMRLHPVAPLLTPKCSREGAAVAGWHVPAGTEALVNVWAIGRDPEVWAAAEEFKPERFLAGRSIDVKGQDLQLLPFGAGRRMCPGYELGIKVILCSLANLLHGFLWRLPEGTSPEMLSMEEIYGMTTTRKFPLVVFPEPRLEAHLYAAAL